MTSDLATSAKSDVSVARWVAMIAGLLGFVMAVATPLLPVTQTTATLSWPQQGQVGNVTAPLISQAPVELRATVPCEVIDTMPGDGGLVLGTAPEQGRDAALNAMLVMVSESRVDVIVRNVVVASVDRDRMGGCSELVITSSLDGTYAEFVGLTQDSGPDAGSPQRTGYPDPNLRPAIVGVSNRRAILNASPSDGSCLPVSIALTAWRDTSSRPASSAWLQSRSARRTLRRFFMQHLLRARDALAASQPPIAWTILAAMLPTP